MSIDSALAACQRSPTHHSSCTHSCAMCVFIQTRAKLRARQGLALFWYWPSRLSTNTSSLRSCRRRKGTGKESRQSSGAAQTPALFCACPTPSPSLPSTLLQHSRSWTVCLQRPELTVQNSSRAWTGAEGGSRLDLGRRSVLPRWYEHTPTSQLWKRENPTTAGARCEACDTHPSCTCGPSWSSRVWRN